MSAIQYRVCRDYFLNCASGAREEQDVKGLRYYQQKLRLLRRLRWKKG